MSDICSIIDDFFNHRKPIYLKPEYQPDTRTMTESMLLNLPSPPEGKTGWPWDIANRGSCSSDNKMVNQPRISIITPSYNQGQYIEETIRSVLLQNYQNLEYIIIDGGSTDSTLQILKKYSRFITWISEPDEGQTDAINKGLKMASGEIVAYLNSDDIYEPGTLISIVNLFYQREDIAMIYGDIIHIDEKSNFIELHKTGTVNLQKYLMAGEFYLPQPSVFFRKCVINTVGYFDKKLHLAMDYDYWLKILLNFTAYYMPETLSRARIYPQAKSSSLNYKYLDELLSIYDSLFIKYHELEPLRRNVYSFAHFAGAISFMKRHHMRDAVKNFRIALQSDPRYLFHPYLYWAIVEMCIGERNANKIRPQVANLFKSIFHIKSYNIIR